MSNKRTQTYEEEIAELRNTHFATRLDERVATATMFNRLLDELKRCYERLDAQKRQFSEIFELCSEYIDPRDVSEMTIQQGRILAEIWSMASYAKDEKELPDFTASE